MIHRRALLTASLAGLTLVMTGSVLAEKQAAKQPSGSVTMSTYKFA